MKRIYHHYTLWEEYKYGMWKTFHGQELDNFLIIAIEFTGNHLLYGYWMKEVIRLWEYSCEHNLSDNSINRQAWIGHAACCLALGCPEHVTRLAWHSLSDNQQILANLQATEAIKEWEGNQCRKDQLGLMY